MSTSVSDKQPARTWWRIAGGVLATIILLVSSRWCAAQTYVAPGSSGSIEFPIWNSSLSQAAFPQATLSVSGPSFFLVQGASKLGPTSISPGSTYTFVVDYSIDPSASSGPFNAVLTAVMDQSQLFQLTNSLPFSATVQFSVDNSTPSLNPTSSGNGGGQPSATLPAVFPSTYCVVFHAGSSGSGVGTMVLTGPPAYGSSTGTFPSSSSAVFGPFCDLPPGNYVVCAYSSVGVATCKSFTVTAGTNELAVCATSPQTTLCNSAIMSDFQSRHGAARALACNGSPGTCGDPTTQAQMTLNLGGAYTCGGPTMPLTGVVLDFQV